MAPTGRALIALRGQSIGPQRPTHRCVRSLRPTLRLSCRGQAEQALLEPRTARIEVRRTGARATGHELEVGRGEDADRFGRSGSHATTQAGVARTTPGIRRSSRSSANGHRRESTRTDPTDLTPDHPTGRARRRRSAVTRNRSCASPTQPGANCSSAAMAPNQNSAWLSSVSSSESHAVRTSVVSAQLETSCVLPEPAGAIDQRQRALDDPIEQVIEPMSRDEVVGVCRCAQLGTQQRRQARGWYRRCRQQLFVIRSSEAIGQGFGAVAKAPEQ